MNSPKYVAFTFDDGPVEWSDASTAISILHTLEMYKQHATFFYIGQQITDQNSKEIAFAKSIGCEIGNHGYTHSDLTKLSDELVTEEIMKTGDKLAAITGNYPVLVRPPYLAYNETLLQLVTHPLISCSIDTRDWDKATTEQIIETILSADEVGKLNGSIILMHEPYKTTASAVQYLVPTLLHKGYQIVSVSELAKVNKMSLQEHQLYTRI